MMQYKMKEYIQKNKNIANIIKGSLKINYRPLANTALYDICDLSGSILKSGKFEEGNTFDISFLRRGMYMLYIIDCDKVLKERFSYS